MDENDNKKSGRLVLTRKLHESVYIGDDITITILHVEHGKVKIAVSAPRNIPVFRKELLVKKETTGTTDETTN